MLERIITRDIPKEVAERKERLRLALELGLEAPGIVALHGTSMEAMRRVVLQGGLSGSMGHDIPFSLPGVPVLSAYYLRSRERPVGLDDELFAEELLDEATSYAMTIAKSHAILSFLKLDPGLRHELPTHAELILGGSFGKRCRAEACQRLGVRPEQLQAALDYAGKRAGIVIGLSEDMLSRYEYVETNEGGEHHEIAIRCPGELDAKYLVGLEPQSRDEWKEMEILLR